MTGARCSAPPSASARRAGPPRAGVSTIRNRLTRYRSPTYGPLAFGTSARSTRLTDWPAGGFIGIHGTDQPGLLPGRVSHGCIRMRNGDIVRLGRLDGRRHAADDPLNPHPCLPLRPTGWLARMPAKEQVEEAEAVAVSAVAAPVSVPLTQYGQVLALQRSAGNRAVAQMIAQGAAIARDTTTVEKYIREESNSTDDTTWTAKYDVSFDEDASPPTCWLTINVKLNPGAGVSKDDVTQTKIRARSRFSLLWDSEFILHEHRTVWADRDWLLRPEVKFVDSGQHLTVNLHAGRGNDDRQNWYMGSPEWVYAHEVSHQMGLLDEYASDSAPKRKVYDDNSIMGDYVNEGMTKAEAKLRHGERLAEMIGKATDKDLKARKR